ncbi:MAG: ATP-dependent RecD-like DNA helicase [Myxococcota bacterium]|nr:ATP-dependent RecD-like DNA helicase [Myxococcota bacterium]
MNEPTNRIEGELLGFTFRTEDGGFSVARIRTDDQRRIIAVGPIGHVTEGQHLILKGSWVTHASHGRQFKVKTVLVEDPRTDRGLIRYLSSGAVTGLGKEFAKRVVDAFGVDTLRIIEEEPERLREVPGIGKKRMETIRDHWALDQSNREVYATLHGYGIGRALANRIVERFGEKAPSIIHNQPYLLAEHIAGVGFRTADRIATENGIEANHPDRADAAVRHLLREAEGQGHCFLPRRELMERAVNLNIAADNCEAAIARLVLNGKLTAPPTVDAQSQPLYAPALERAERQVARRLLELALAHRDAPPASPPMLSRVEASARLTLNEDQRRAVLTALTGGVTVITGGPGTGKTTIVRLLLHVARTRKERWVLAAPTGRASRRLAEATDSEAKTIHRLLEFNGRTGQFQRNTTNPLNADGVLVDEASMVDIRLMTSLLAAVPIGCRLVLVGDADQLPSVGAGRVLGDIIQAGTLPVCTLSEVYRQAADSGIIQNAHRINEGASPVSGERAEGRPDFYEIHRPDAMDAQQTVVEVVTSRLKQKGFDPLVDVQVLTPMHNGPLGTDALNTTLQRALNPTGPSLQRGQRTFRVRDRIIQLRNDYDNDIFNGDIGTVLHAHGGALAIDFEGRQVTLKGEQLNDIELAYAISIHKSQGSEYPAVVMVLHRAHFVMLRRNLLYTGVTRAKRFCCIVGDRWAVRRAVSTPGGDERWTRLTDRLTV